VISEDNWETYKPTIINQHRTEIPIFREEGVSNERLKLAYQRYMSGQGVYGTAEELQVASLLFRFSFTILQREGSTYWPWSWKRESYTPYNFPHPDEGKGGVDEIPWNYFRFSGPSNRGHWERLFPIFIPDK
jgi:hypothetical protein